DRRRPPPAPAAGRAGGGDAGGDNRAPLAGTAGPPPAWSAHRGRPWRPRGSRRAAPFGPLAPGSAEAQDVSARPATGCRRPERRALRGLGVPRCLVRAACRTIV